MKKLLFLCVLVFCNINSMGAQTPMENASDSDSSDREPMVDEELKAEYDNYLAQKRNHKEIHDEYIRVKEEKEQLLQRLSNVK